MCYDFQYFIIGIRAHGLISLIVCSELGSELTSLAGSELSLASYRAISDRALRETLTEGAEGALHLGPKRPRVYSDLTSKEKDMYNADIRATTSYFKGETIHDYYVRLAKLINGMRNIKMTMSRMQLNSKFVNNMLPEWGRFVTVVKLNIGLRDSNYDQLYAYLKQHEAHANENKMMLDHFTQHTVDPLVLMSNVSNQQHYPQSSTTLPSTCVQPYLADTTQLDSRLSPKDNLIENLTNTLALLTQSYKTYLPQTNNRLRTSLNPRNQATIQDGNVVIQNDLSLNVDNVFQADDCDAFDSDVDEAPTAQTMFMANLSSADPVYDEAGLSYDSDVLIEVHDHGHYQDVVCEYHEVHEMHDDVQPNYVVDSHTGYTSDSNMIIYDQYVKDNAMQVVQSDVSTVPNDAYMMILNDMHEPPAQHAYVTTQTKVVDKSLTAKLATYKEQVELYERRAKFELTEREQKINEQLRIVITDRNIKKENLEKELHSKENQYLEEFLDMKALKEKVEDKLFKQDQSLQTVHMLYKPTPYYDEQRKAAIGYKSPLCLTRAKQVQPALYNGHEIIKTHYVPAIVHNSKDTLEIAEITRKKMNEKMKTPLWTHHKINIRPPNYSKDNFLATFTPQTQLTPKQIFWSKDVLKMKTESLKEQAKAAKLVKALTVYPLITPVKLVPRVLPTKSQVKINVSALIQLFSEFKKTYKKRITPTGLTEGDRDSVTPKVLAPGMYAIDVEPIPPRFRKNKEVHLDYIKHLKESVATLHEIVKEAKVERSLDRSVASAYLYTKHLGPSMYVQASGHLFAQLAVAYNKYCLPMIENELSFLEHIREFTHRVKSVSMAKFTSQEVSALQGGENAVMNHLFAFGFDLH
nr:NSP (nuclear shuttle protein)-interacting GTPase [Tanacetum cinerariifolium]